MENAFARIRLILIKIYLWVAELLYGPFAWAYDAVAWLVSFGYWSRWRLDALEFVQADPILELGFGTGALLIEMSALNYNVTGLELSPQMQRLTSRKLRKSGLQIKRVRANSDAIPFPTNAFATAISTFPSNYILSEETLKEIRRILIDGGKVVIVGTGAEFLSGWKKFLAQGFFGVRKQGPIESCSKKLKTIGFSCELKEKLTKDYRLLVLILRKENDQ